MSSTINSEPSTTSPPEPAAVLRPPSSGILRRWLPIAAFSLLWLDLCRQLSYVWQTNEQYAYGWFVPILALGLFWKKWPSRPLTTDHGPQTTDSQLPAAPKPGEGGSILNSQPPQVSSPVVSGLVVLCAALLLPLRVIYEINPDWPLISWSYALIVVTLTLYALHLADPSSRGPWSVVSPWVLHFAFPVCFILGAVQWPGRIEYPLTQGLMRLDTNITVEILGWLNIPAMQRGNLIELATGAVGVNEACSGIRSFQSTFMAALFLGELYLLRRRTRLLLVVSGLVLAFGLNVVRTVILAWQANAHGLSAIDKWHDPAGFTITIACFLGLWAVAVLIKRRTTGLRDHGTIGARVNSTPGLQDHGPRTTDPLSSVASAKGDPASAFSFQLSAFQRSPESPPVSNPLVSISPTAEIRPLTSDPQPSGPFCFLLSAFYFVSWRRFMLATGCWSLLCIGATEAWYRAHEAKAPDFVRWSVSLPDTNPTFQKVDLPPRTLQLLNYDRGSAAKWQEDEDAEWNVVFLRWDGKSMPSIMAARSHNPEVCLPASGLQKLSNSGIEYVETGRLKLPFQEYTYSVQGRSLYVFYCVWQDGDELRRGMRSYKPADRLQMVIERRRRFGQQKLEISVNGYSSMAEAERAVRRHLPDLIQIEGQVGPPTLPRDNGVSTTAEERSYPPETISGLRLSK